MAMLGLWENGLLKGHHKNPMDDPDWATRDAPDNAAMIAAVRVQQLMLAQNYHTDFVDYVIEAYGETREQAEIIVRNCK